MPEWFTGAAVIAFLTLTALEIVLGIDNIVFIAILTGKLDPSVRARARRLGLGGAMVMRVALLLAISAIMKLQATWFELPLPIDEQVRAISGKDLILIVGGLFLIFKSTWEIHDKLEGPEPEKAPGKSAVSFASAIAQIMLLDLVFSLDSVITAVGMLPPEQIGIMIAAVIVAVLVMLAFAGPICDFVERHPTIKMLALSFLILIGVMLVAEGFESHINRGYIYFAMGFSLGVELLNIRFRKVHKPVHLHEPTLPAESREPA